MELQPLDKIKNNNFFRLSDVDERFKDNTSTQVDIPDWDIDYQNKEDNHV